MLLILKVNSSSKERKGRCSAFFLFLKETAEIPHTISTYMSVERNKSYGTTQLQERVQTNLLAGQSSVAEEEKETFTKR